MKLRALSIVLLAAAASFASAKKDVPGAPAVKGAVAGRWTQDYDAAVALSKEQGLPLMLKFTGSDWCGWCKLMEGVVFATSEFEKWADGRVVLVTLDFPRSSDGVPREYRERNNRLAAEHGIRGYPTYVVKDSEGKELGRLGASRDASVDKFTHDFEALVGTMPEKKAAAPAAAAATEDEMEQWIRSHLSLSQQKAFREKLSDSERAEFPSLAFAGRDLDAALERLAQERRKFVDDVQKELSELSPADPDAAKARKEKALAELKELDAAQAVRTAEIKAERERKRARLQELLRKLN
ncbi:MAG: thioredoxin family protein [Kiritimatiellae bacterium]|nr:thioredoxin family protein [Kiritimatiellia bacterium]